ncbi:MAG: hypothetical protein J6D28_01045 [Bacilli bacterium]|nr:hypothetical protein [Bacilli bacterium]
MKEIFTEEEYNDAVKKFNEQLMNNFYEDRNNYCPYKGYDDLRNYSLNENEFQLLWRCQELLHSFEENNDLLSENISNIYQTIRAVYNTSFVQVKR